MLRTAGEDVLFTVRVDDAGGGIGRVFAELAAIGGDRSNDLYDDGTNGDVTDGDGIYSLSLSTDPDIAGGTYTIPLAGTDSTGVARSLTETQLTVVSVAEVFLTAWDALVVQGGLTSGRWALVHAGASGVGTAAIQIAKAIGVDVEFVRVTSPTRIPLLAGRDFAERDGPDAPALAAVLPPQVGPQVEPDARPAAVTDCADTGCTAPGACQGACHEGTRVCSAGSWGACSGAVTTR